MSKLYEVFGINLPLQPKSKLDILKEKYESRDYIYLHRYFSYHWTLLPKPKFGEFKNGEYKLIHKKHKVILDAYLADNSVDIEFYIERYMNCWLKESNFIENYDEDFEYRLKPQEFEYPIFKRNNLGWILKYESDIEYSVVFAPSAEFKFCLDKYKSLKIRVDNVKSLQNSYKGLNVINIKEAQNNTEKFNMQKQKEDKTKTELLIDEHLKKVESFIKYKSESGDTVADYQIEYGMPHERNKDDMEMLEKVAYTISEKLLDNGFKIDLRDNRMALSFFIRISWIK